MRWLEWVLLYAAVISLVYVWGRLRERARLRGILRRSGASPQFRDRARRE